jgi:acyl-[acyl-carrier-protein]-phospholipid O-acyltransferase / long-chain-fatty-acid--[acyl-carrier-protein] ligase
MTIPEEKNMLLHHEFIRTAKKHGRKMAIIDKTRNKEVTYQKALIAALMLAKKFGKYEDSYVGVMVPTSAGCILASTGLLMAGKTPVMINYSTGAKNNCLYARNKCGFHTILTSRALLQKISCPEMPGMICLEDIMDDIGLTDKLPAALKSKLSADSIIKKLPETSPDDNCVILFTSGSEKEPKAVQLTHRNIYSNIQGAIERFELTSDDIIMSILPLFHVFGLMTNFWLPMILGATAVTYANPLDYKTIPKLVKSQKATMITGTPIFYAGYLRESKEGDFETMKTMVGGADKIPDSLREGYQKKHGITLLEGYGTTETSPVISANTLKENKPGSIGRPFPDVHVKITHIETGAVLPSGQEGKILVKGPNVMKGYYDDLEETSFRIHDGWYDTGDMGLIDEDGYLWHKGRLKRFVKIGGEMISLVRTENVLEKLLPRDIYCCVVEIPDAKKGARLIAAVTGKVNNRELINKMKEELPAIALPAAFVEFDDLPKMGSGKMDFRTITEMVKEKVRK